jgi:hypothetical protein
MQQFDTFFPSPALSSLYILPEMIIRIKKIQSDIITMEIKQLMK